MATSKNLFLSNSGARMQAVPYQTHSQYAKLSRPSLSTPAHATAWAICLGSKADPEAVDSRSAGVIDNQRRVIGKALRLVDSRRPRPRGDAGRGDLVIEAPADILGPCLAALRPPPVIPQFGMQPAKHIDETCLIE